MGICSWNKDRALIVITYRTANIRKSPRNIIDYTLRLFSLFLYYPLKLVTISPYFIMIGFGNWLNLLLVVSIKVSTLGFMSTSTSQYIVTHLH